MKETVICKIQCTAPDGQTGSFLIDKNRNVLVSPICRDLVELYAWCKKHGWRAKEQRVDCSEYVRDAGTLTGGW